MNLIEISDNVALAVQPLVAVAAGVGLAGVKLPGFRSPDLV